MNSETFLYLVCFVVWYLVGVVSFIYWWTKTSDLTIRELHVLFCAGFMGPITFILGWILVGDATFSIDGVIVRKRK